ERIYAAVMTLIELLEGFHVAVGGFLRQLIVRSCRCLDFACCHVSSLVSDQEKGRDKSGRVLRRVPSLKSARNFLRKAASTNAFAGELWRWNLREPRVRELPIDSIGRNASKFIRRSDVRSLTISENIMVTTSPPCVSSIIAF